LSSKPRQRHLREIGHDELRSAVEALADLVGPRFPQRVHRGEGQWPIAATGLIAEMISTARSVAMLNASGAHNDVLVLLRTLYEQVVTFCWLAIDSDRHLVAWANEAHLERLRLHNDAVDYGHSILTEEEVEAIKQRRGMPRLVERAAAIDDFWPSHIPRSARRGKLRSSFSPCAGCMSGCTGSPAALPTRTRRLWTDSWITRSIRGGRRSCGWIRSQII
jgi:hypothetical protein